MDEPSFGSLVVKSALDVSASAPFAMSVARESDARAFSLAVARAPHVVELSMGCSGAATACVMTRVFGCGG